MRVRDGSYFHPAEKAHSIATCIFAYNYASVKFSYNPRHKQYNPKRFVQRGAENDNQRRPKRLFLNFYDAVERGNCFFDCFAA